MSMTEKKKVCSWGISTTIAKISCKPTPQSTGLQRWLDGPC